MYISSPSNSNTKRHISQPLLGGQLMCLYGAFCNACFLIAQEKGTGDTANIRRKKQLTVTQIHAKMKMQICMSRAKLF